MKSNSSTPLNPVSRARLFTRHLLSRILAILTFLMLIALVADPRTRAKLHTFVRHASTAVLYTLNRHHADLSALDLFAAQNPVFTKHISPKTLKKTLRARRRTIGGVVNTTLIAACSDSSPVLARTVASWNNVRGVREVVIVDYDSRREGLLRALKVIDSIDRLGRIIHVAVVRENGKNPSYTATSFSASSSSSSSSSSSASSRGSTGIPPTGQWERSRAFNLGAAISSGNNLLFVDCHTVTAPNLLSEHPLQNGSVNVAFANPPAPEEVAFRWLDVVHITREDFLAVVGFDERIDVPGYDMADLVERLRRGRALSWRAIPSGFITRVSAEDHGPLAFQRDWTGVDALARVGLIPELALYASMIAGQELPVWSGRLLDGSLTMLTLRPVRLGVLRRQLESLEGHAEEKKPRFGPRRQSDFRLWIHATLKRTNTVSMVDALPRPLRAQVLLTAHRYMLHDRHAVPWAVLEMVEERVLTRTTPTPTAIATAPTTGSYLETYGKTYQGVISAWASGGRNGTLWRKSMRPSPSPVGVREGMEQRMEGYSDVLFDLLWRRSLLLVVSIESYDGMSLLRGVAWAISAAISRNRALVLVGSMDEDTPLHELIDLSGTSNVLEREYNLKLKVLGGHGALNCTEEEDVDRPERTQDHENLGRRNKQPSCWGNDTAGVHWDARTAGDDPSTLGDEAGKHAVVRINTRRVVEWGAAASPWVRRLQAQAFASVMTTHRVRNAVVGGMLGKRAAVWPTRRRRKIRERPDDVVASSAREGKGENEEKEELEGQDQNFENVVAMARKRGASSLVVLRGDRGTDFRKGKDQRVETRQVTNKDTAVHKVADVLAALQCRSVVFDSVKLPTGWGGADEAIVEWRRVHGVSNDGSRGVSHVRSPPNTSVEFSEMILSDGDS